LRRVNHHERIEDIFKKNTDLGKLTTEEQMIKEYGSKEDNILHMPLTLDQFYYYSIADNSDRDVDQVLYRHQEQGKPKATSGTTPESQNKAKKSCRNFICMVDELWLFMIDKRK
jgi:hypothetical protein